MPRRTSTFTGAFGLVFGVAAALLIVGARRGRSALDVVRRLHVILALPVAFGIAAMMLFSLDAVRGCVLAHDRPYAAQRQLCGAMLLFVHVPLAGRSIFMVACMLPILVATLVSIACHKFGQA